MAEESENTLASVAKKIIAIGDTECGKTSLLVVFSKDYYSDARPPVFYENYDVKLDVHGKLVQLTLRDTPGLEDYDILRTLAYPDSDVILLCFAIDKPESLANISKKWILEARKFCPDAPMILVGNKLDLRNEGSTSQVSFAEGLAFATKIAAYKYVECSAKTKEGIQEVFDSAAVAALQAEQEKNK